METTYTLTDGPMSMLIQETLSDSMDLKTEHAKLRGEREEVERNLKREWI